MQTISHTFPGGAEICAYLHEGDESMPASLRCEHPAVIIFPGGAYAFTSPREADPVALAFLSMGYQTFIVRYRTGEQAGGKRPLEDAARSIAWVRAHSAKWYIDPEKIVVLGFSAGGHLAASLGVHWNDAEIAARLELSPNEARAALRPNAMVLCYPVITASEHAHSDSIRRVSAHCKEDVSYWALEQHVTPDTPPAFLWHTVADPAVPVENSLLMASALHRAGVPCEVHLFERGGHGMSVCTPEVNTPNAEAAEWVSLCRAWLCLHFGEPGGMGCRFSAQQA